MAKLGRPALTLARTTFACLGRRGDVAFPQSAEGRLIEGTKK
jgi:hypothetical protein